MTEGRSNVEHARGQVTKAFRRLTRIAARLVDAPASVILLADGVQASYAREKEGRELGGPAIAAVREELAPHVIDTGESLVVEDAGSDPVFRSSRLFDSIGVAAFAAVPVRRAGGEVVGAFCVLDWQPRAWAPDAAAALSDLAASVVSELELGEARAAARPGEVGREVAEQDRTDQALRESEEKFRDIAENVREIFWIFNPDFTETIYVSPAYEEIWGRKLEEIYRDPSTFARAVHPDDVDTLKTAMREIRTTVLAPMEFRIIRSDGSVRWVMARGYPVIGPDGEVERVVGTTRDITARKETEAQLASAEAHYRHLVENAPYAIYALDADGRFIDLNPAGEQFLEMDVEDVLGKHFSEVIAAVDLEVATEAFDRVVSGEADHLEFHERIRRPSGEVRLLQVTESAIRQGGEIIGTHGVARDITDEAEKEQQLRRAQRLASIGTLVEGVAHELNNPLQAITNFATILLEDSGSDEQREDLETIQREAMRAARIVSDLRQLAGRTKEETSERRAVDLNDVARHVVETRRFALEIRGVLLEKDLSPDLPPVMADPGKLDQVLLNLIVNAEHAVQDREDRRITVRTRATRDAVTLEVLDTGPGIAAEHLERVFDPFFTTKVPGKGTGLGLAIVHAIVSEHGGAVRAERSDGGGTAVLVELPRATADQAPSGGSIVPTDSERKLRILVVDDEASVRRALVRYLTRRRGHVVDAAADGREALRILEAEGADYDVVISDLRMPGLSGDQLLAQLSALGTGVDRRIIFLTGDSASGHAASVLEAAKVPVIYKPVELPELAAVVEGFAAVV